MNEMLNESLLPEQFREIPLPDDPVEILGRQADFFNRRFSNEMVATIESRISSRETTPTDLPDSVGDCFAYTFVLRAPALGNYEFRLFFTYVPLLRYPTTIVFADPSNLLHASEPDQFRDQLRMIFAHDWTARVIANFRMRIRQWQRNIAQ